MLNSDKSFAVFWGAFGVLGLLQALYYFDFWLLVQAVAIIGGAYVFYITNSTLVLLGAVILAAVVSRWTPETPIWPTMLLMVVFIVFSLYRIYQRRT